MSNLCNNVLEVCESDFDKLIPMFSTPLPENYLDSNDLYLSGVCGFPLHVLISKHEDKIHIAFQTKWIAPVSDIEALAKKMMIDLTLYAVELGCSYGIKCEYYFDDTFDPSTATLDDINEWFYMYTKRGITDEIYQIVFGESL